MKPLLASALFRDDLCRLAARVGATEAAGFRIEMRHDRQFWPRLLAHIRPGASTPEQRQAAVEEFQRLVLPCIRSGRDGVMELGTTAGADKLMYCLVALLPPAVAVAAIVLCADAEEARDRLRLLRGE